MFTQTKEDPLENLSDRIFKDLFYKMKEQPLTDSQIAKILMQDCLELKIDDNQFTEKSYPSLSRIFEYTHENYAIPKKANDSIPVIETPLDFAVFLVVLKSLPDDLFKLTKPELYEKFMHQWYLKELDKLLIKNNFELPFRDPYTDFKTTAEFLATTLHKQKILKDSMSEVLKDPMSEVKAEFKDANPVDIENAIAACPLRKNKDGTYVFIHPDIESFLKEEAIYHDLRDSRESPRPL